MDMKVEQPQFSDAELLNCLDTLEGEYGGIYIEFGGFRDWKTIGKDARGWYYHDYKHRDDEFRVPTLRLAIECLINPPDEEAWEQNKIDQEEASPNPEDVDK